MSAVESTFRRAALVPFAAALLLGGCETSSPSEGGPGAVRKPAATRAAAELALVPAAKLDALVHGMSEAQVRQLLGEPRSVRAATKLGPGASVWIYRIGATEGVTQVPVSMEDVPSYNPLTGQPTIRQEPVYRNQHVTTYRTLELLFLDGLLAKRTTGQEVERWFE